MIAQRYQLIFGTSFLYHYMIKYTADAINTRVSLLFYDEEQFYSCYYVDRKIFEKCFRFSLMITI